MIDLVHGKALPHRRALWTVRAVHNTPTSKASRAPRGLGANVFPCRQFFAAYFESIESRDAVPISAILLERFLLLVSVAGRWCFRVEACLYSA